MRCSPSSGRRKARAMTASGVWPDAGADCADAPRSASVRAIRRALSIRIAALGVVSFGASPETGAVRTAAGATGSRASTGILEATLLCAPAAASWGGSAVGGRAASVADSGPRGALAGAGAGRRRNTATCSRSAATRQAASRRTPARSVITGRFSSFRSWRRPACSLRGVAMSPEWTLLCRVYCSGWQSVNEVRGGRRKRLTSNRDRVECAPLYSRRVAQLVRAPP